MMNNIQMIDVNRLHPHPDNPRKDVGDVTELADSIRHSGVMQNLTVVPHEGDYRVIIGHRRLAAAKEAGLTELPCRVVEMTEREQVATMIAENMQRTDLTVPEQVHGIQMMLDLGESLEDVQKKTGLSRSTVYHRKAMAALPADELQKSWERGGTIADYVALEGIKDEKTKKELLKQIGTGNFAYELRRAKDNQAYKERLDDVLVLLEPVMRRTTTEPYGSDCWRSADFRDDCNWKAKIRAIVREVESQTEGEYLFFIGKNEWNKWTVKVRRKLNEAEKAKEESEYERREKEKEQRKKALKELDERIEQVRLEALRRLHIPQDARNRIAALWMTSTSYVGDWQKPSFMKQIFGSEGEVAALIKTFDDLCLADPEGMMLPLMVLMCDSAYTWEGAYGVQQDDMDIRALLLSLGYQESDEEKAYWTGTHELFLKEEQADV